MSGRKANTGSTATGTAKSAQEILNETFLSDAPVKRYPKFSFDSASFDEDQARSHLRLLRTDQRSNLDCL